MKLKKLLKILPKAQVKGSKEVEITGISVDSRLVSPGNLFIAKKGNQEDGHKYIPEALSAGCVAVLSDIFDPFLDKITQIIVPDVNAVEGDVAAHFHQYPSDDLFMVGITGTNGKTMTSFLVKHVLDRIKGPCGLLGTIEYVIGRHRYGAVRTTPDVCSCHKLLKEMVLQECKSAVMEVTSHGLEQERVANVNFDVAIFTNLTQDHLDYHTTMDAYAHAKAKLFARLGKGEREKGFAFSPLAVINADSPYAETMLADCTSATLSYGLEAEADLKAVNLHLGAQGSQFTVTYGNASCPVEWPLIGRFNVYNFLAALSVPIGMGFPLPDAVELLQGFEGVKGRLAQVPNDRGIRVFVDFAHTDDALKNVLECLTEFKTGKIITVFGCGGARDSTKRPKMARVSEAFSDFTIVTSDNPRNEDPQTIADDIVKGFKKKKSYTVEIDRRKALEKALDLAVEGDIVLVAGKGHEGYQVFAHKTLEFDDAEVCRELLGATALAR